MSKGLRLTFDDAWLLGGARTPFVDYRGALAEISPIDLGIKAARAAIARTGVKPADIGHTIAGSMAQASFDAHVTPRHIGLYAGASRSAYLRHRPRGDLPGGGQRVAGARQARDQIAPRCRERRCRHPYPAFAL